MILQRATLPLFGLLFVFLISEARGHEHLNNKLELVESWKTLDFLYPTLKDRNEAIACGDFIPGVFFPSDIAIYYNKSKDETRPRIFVAIPRSQKGVPVTLGYVTNKRAFDGSALIAPYPDWESQRTDNCDMLIDVRKIENDRCGRLWVVDSGLINGVQICDPKLLSFSLKTNKLLSKYRFKLADYYSFSFLIHPIVDVRGDNCEDTFVYLGDTEGYGIIVYDHQNMCSWRIDNKVLWPYPEAGTFSIDGYEYELMYGISGMALSPEAPNGDKILYFHSLSSFVESYVSTSVIRNRTLFQKNSWASPRSIMTFKNKRSSQSAAEAMDRYGVLFFGLLTERTIVCWNSKHDYDVKNFETIASDPETLQFPTGLRLVPRVDGSRELWTLTIAFQRYRTGKMSPNETNFRIQVGKVDELIRKTKCDVAH